MLKNARFWGDIIFIQNYLKTFLFNKLSMKQSVKFRYISWQEIVGNKCSLYIYNV